MKNNSLMWQSTSDKGRGKTRSDPTAKLKLTDHVLVLDVDPPGAVVEDTRGNVYYVEKKYGKRAGVRRATPAQESEIRNSGVTPRASRPVAAYVLETLDAIRDQEGHEEEAGS